MDEPIMRPTYLPMCKCSSRRVMLVNGILRCAECMAVYGEGGSYNYTDGILEHLIKRSRERYPHIPEKNIKESWVFDRTCDKPQDDIS